jgi:hypothetical protein
MAEFTYNPIQLITAGQSAILNTTIPCNKGYVYHRNESGIVILRGIVNNPTNCYARYKVTFNGNIAVPEDGTPGEISVALSIDGEPLLTSNAIVTPTAADAYFNVTSTAFITVPKGCCFSVSVENTSTISINMQNANLVVERVA